MARVFKDIAFLEKAACDMDHRQKQSRTPAVLRYEPPFTCRAFEHPSYASNIPGVWGLAPKEKVMTQPTEALLH